MSSSNYDPKLSQAGFMDLVAALQSRLKTDDSVQLLSRMPPAQREAVLQLGVVAKNYVDVLEGPGLPLALVDSHPKTNEHELTKALTERDQAEDMADQLAAQISAITCHEIGEHTSANDPWRNALQAAREWHADSTITQLDLSKSNFLEAKVLENLAHIAHEQRNMMMGISQSELSEAYGVISSRLGAAARKLFPLFPHPDFANNEVQDWLRANNIEG